MAAFSKHQYNVDILTLTILEFIDQINVNKHIIEMLLHKHLYIFMYKKLNQIGNLKIYYKDKNLADKILLLICYKMVNSIHTKIF